jgi:hypothetical protein
MDQQGDFDLEAMRLPQDYTAALGTKKLLTVIPIRKPGKHEFIRVHREEDWRLQTMLLELREERETYFVYRNLWASLTTELTPKLLLLAINRQKVVFLWPIRIPGEDGRLDPWNQSALDAARLATDRWVRIAANMSLGAYEIFQAANLQDEPVWPEVTFAEIIKVAFKNRMISDWDHPVLKRLRGEI